jgi:hypothetical protein
MARNDMDKPKNDNTESNNHPGQGNPGGGPDSGTGSSSGQGSAERTNDTANAPSPSDRTTGNEGGSGNSGNQGKYSAQPSSGEQASGEHADGGEHHEWLASWKDRLGHVDQKLIEVFNGAKDRAMDKAEDIGLIARLRVEEWLDKSEMDDKARAQWDKVKGDGKLFAAQVENRITHLIANGQIVWANWKKKIDEARDEVQHTVEKAEDKLEAKG